MSHDPCGVRFYHAAPAHSGAQRERKEALEINSWLDRAYALRRLNEPCLEALLERLEKRLQPESRRYWLLAARILEAGVLCAGEYRDCAEYQAAADLLVNPRRVRIHFADGSRAVKPRHTGLSEVSKARGEGQKAFREQSRGGLRSVKCLW